MAAPIVVLSTASICSAGAKDTRATPSAALKSLGPKGLIAAGDKQIKLRLPPVAEKQGLHHLHIQLLIDRGAILHCDDLVGVHPLKWYLQGFKGLIDALLQCGPVHFGPGCLNFADCNYPVHSRLLIFLFQCIIELYI